MLGFFEFTHQGMDMETYLNQYGLTAGIFSKFADQGLKNLKFLIIMNWITEEEAQKVLNRIIAKIGGSISEINEEGVTGSY